MSMQNRAILLLILIDNSSCVPDKMFLKILIAGVWIVAVETGEVNTGTLIFPGKSTW